MKFLVCLFTVALATYNFAQPAPTASIMENLLSGRQDRFSTIAQIIQAAGLSDTLSKDGPFILFAPSNDAFKALPEAIVSKLVANPADLKKVLLRHVVKTSSPPSELKAGDLTSVEGGVLKVAGSVGDNSMTVSNAKLLTAMNAVTSTMSSNGVIYYIDRVLLPA